MVFVVHGKPFRAHRCVLGVRSAYFANMLDTKWKGKNVVVLRHPLVCPPQGGRGTAGGLCWVATSDLSSRLSLPADQPYGLRGPAAVPVHR